MIHSEEYAKKLMVKVLEDIAFDYRKDKPIQAKYSENSTVLEKGMKSGWIVWAEWYNPVSLKDKENDIVSLIIDDENGNAIVLGVRTGGGGNWELARNEEGKYYVKSRY